MLFSYSVLYVPDDFVASVADFYHWGRCNRRHYGSRLAARKFQLFLDSQHRLAHTQQFFYPTILGDNLKKKKRRRKNDSRNKIVYFVWRQIQLNNICLSE